MTPFPDDRPLLDLAVFEPEIPGNAGAVARVCAATATPLHFIGRLGFSFRHPAAKRAGMDYWEDVQLHRHINFSDFREATQRRRVWGLTTKATTSLWDVQFATGDILLLGPESRGLPSEILETLSETTLRIPMAESARSLNLSTAAAISLYEALRQLRSDSR